MLNKKAFTLIEVIISLALFTMISISLTQVINQTTRAQKQVEYLVKKSRILKNTSYLIQKDIKNSLRTTNTIHWAYTSYDGCLLNRFGSREFLAEPYMNVEDQNFLLSSRPFPFMQMEGQSDQIFIANISPQGILQKIEYTIENCLDDEEDVPCLVRKTYEIIDDINLASEDTEKIVPLIKNVDELIFSYYDPQTKSWIDRFEQKNKNNFSPQTLERSEYFPFPLPLALKVELTIDNTPLKINIPIETSFLSEKIKSVSSVEPDGNCSYNLSPQSGFPPTTSEDPDLDGSKPDQLTPETN